MEKRIEEIRDDWQKDNSYFDYDVVGELLYKIDRLRNELKGKEDADALAITSSI